MTSILPTHAAAATAFDGLCGRMTSHPDKNLIMELTKSAEEHIDAAPYIANVVVARVIDPATPASHKLPVFYLIDSIMKNVGGPYAFLFSKHISDVYARAANEVSAREREKLKFLVTTWDERKFFPQEVIQKMQAHVPAPVQSQPVQQPMYPVQSPAQQQYMQQQQQQMLYQQQQQQMMYQQQQQMMYQQRQQQQQMMYQQAPQLFSAVPSSANYPSAQSNKRSRWGSDITEDFPGPAAQPSRGGRRPPAARQPQRPAAPLLAQPLAPPAPDAALVQAEMLRLLDAMYAEMGVTEGLSLQELFSINPQLYQQLQYSAEQAVLGQQAASGGSAMSSSSFGGSSDVMPESSPYSGGGDSLIQAFVGEARVTLKKPQALQLASALGAISGGSATLSALAQSLAGLLDQTDVPPRLPPMLLGPLPLEPSAAYKAKLVQADQGQPVAAARRTIPSPPFLADELGKNPALAVQALYGEMQYQYSDDGVRFRRLADLVAHTDLRIRKKEQLRRKELEGARSCRQWMCLEAQWVSDFDALAAHSEQPVSSAVAADAADAALDPEVSVPADENFTRCPVSREVFETQWDEDEGEFVYKGAVRVLIPEGGGAEDERLYRLGRPTAHEAVRYLIVHKRLVLDGWSSNGRAASLRSVVERYEVMGRGREEPAVAALLAAADGEDEDNIFVIILAGLG